MNHTKSISSSNLFLLKIWRFLAQVPPAYYVLIILFLILLLFKPNLTKPLVLTIFFRQVVPLGLIVIGQLLVMRLRCIDLSVGSIILLINYLISSGVLANLNSWMIVLVCLMTGLSVGGLNGILIGKKQLSAVVVTLAMSTILIGLIEFLASGQPPGDIPLEFRQFYNSRWLMIPIPVLIWIVTTLIASLALKQLIYGRFVSVVGENPKAASMTGVSLDRTVLIAYMISGLTAALAGVIQSSSIAVGSLKFGPDLVLNSIAATILGGVVFGKGSGGVWGPFFGVASFALLFAVLTSFGVPQPGKLIVQGLIIAIAAIIYGVRKY